MFFNCFYIYLSNRANSNDSTEKNYISIIETLRSYFILQYIWTLNKSEKMRYKNCLLEKYMNINGQFLGLIASGDSFVRIKEPHK